MFIPFCEGVTATVITWHFILIIRVSSSDEILGGRGESATSEWAFMYHVQFRRALGRAYQEIA